MESKHQCYITVLVRASQEKTARTGWLRRSTVGCCALEWLRSRVELKEFAGSSLFRSLLPLLLSLESLALPGCALVPAPEQPGLREPHWRGLRCWALLHLKCPGAQEARLLEAGATLRHCVRALGCGEAGQVAEARGAQMRVVAPGKVRKLGLMQIVVRTGRCLKKVP